MTTLQELMQQQVDNFIEGSGNIIGSKKPDPTPIVKSNQSKPSVSLQESMQKQIDELDTADAATETFVEKQNNIVVSEDQLREQSALGLPYAGDYDDEIKTIEQQVDENFSRTKTTLKDLDERKTQIETDIEELGIIDQILKDKKLPVDFMGRSQEELSKLRADELLQYIDQKNAIEFEAERRYYNEYIGPDLSKGLKDSPMLQEKK